MYLVEYLGTEGNVSILHRVLGRVFFPNNPDYDGRRVVEVETSRLRDELLEQGNPHGVPPRYAEPTDLLSLRNQRLICDVLIKLGVVSAEQIEEAFAKPPASIDDLPAESEKDSMNISPYAMELAVEHGIDPSSIEGTGKDGTVLKSDVERAIAAKGE